MRDCTFTYYRRPNTGLRKGTEQTLTRQLVRFHRLLPEFLSAKPSSQFISADGLTEHFMLCYEKFI